MKRFFSALTFAAFIGIGASGAANAAGPASMVPQATASAPELVTQVRDRYDRDRYYRGDSYRRHWDRNGWSNQRHYRQHYRPAPSFRLYVEPRVVPRYVQPQPTYRPTYRMSNSHVAWCQSRYRSYRAWDNSWQPYNGPRRLCVSPYR